MKKFYLSIVLLLLAQAHTLAQYEFFNNQERYKINSEQLTDAFNANLDSLMLDSIILAYQNSLSIPGIATLIIKDNEVVWNKNYGYRNLQYQLPVEDSTIFLIVSISKTILATAVMQLWENGLIDLEKNVNNYLPTGFTIANPRFPGDTITVKMLLTHTSSILDNGTIEIPLISCGDSPLSLDSFLVNYLTPGGSYYSLNNYGNYRPGEQWNYSNPGSAVLGLIVENLTGKSFDQYCKDSIFIPLSMNSASWFLAGMDTNQIATPYVGSTPICHQGWPHYPIGFLRTNKFDLAKFLMAYMNGGVYNNVRILDSTTISYMLSDQLGYPAVYLAPWWIWKQGLLWWNAFPINNSAWGHAGSWYGYLTYMSYDPSEKWGTIWFQNWRRYESDVSGLGEINSHFTKYAYLYGNIYALASSVDKPYAKINVDSVLFRSRFSNIYNHQFTPHLIFANLDSTLIDSLTLFDDGLHGDSLSNDGIYGGYISPIPIEDFFALSVSTLDNQTNKYFNTSDLCRFTTAGPVVIDSLIVTYNQFPRTYTIKAAVKNESQSVTLENLYINMSTDDSSITYISGSLSINSLAPGQTIIPSGSFTVRVDTNTFSGEFKFNFNIYSNTLLYWYDSFTYIITEVEDNESLPFTYNLEQNFPNPFNPNTNIKFRIADFEFVSLKVYDLLGREIVTLINEEKPAGEYEVEFNASNLPSGIYFYQLRATPGGGQAGSFVETKKMVLIR
ncbi:MAG: serine hydrolase [Ignavibacteriaceae bacterium]|nr:serine hydrolase [Ignavibacteriaceae bacterium]